ncbi:MAG: LCP family protein [Lachnospiraceae bacterium]|nr:LCP family protein [Lachnospiraceae bacterium]
MKKKRDNVERFNGAEDLDKALAMNRLKNQKRRKQRRILITVEIFVMLILAIVAFVLLKVFKINFTGLDPNKLEIYKDTGPYTNIALFGLDSRDGQLKGGVQSDTMIIASINNKTYEVKLVSVYRDTLTFQSNKRYEKANAAYNMGGPAGAVALLNRNLDMDIKAYASVDFRAVTDAVDALGGIDVKMTAEEVKWMNGYATETSKVVGQKKPALIHGAGVHHLNGVQAVSYARIRYTNGNDMKRAQRQRIVLQKIFDKAKKSNFLKLSKAVDKIFPKVETSLTIKDMLGIAAHLNKYKIASQHGFPFECTTSENVSGHPGSYVVACGMEKNVKELHKYLFDDEKYEPSPKVKAINNDIINMTGIGPDTAAIDLSGIGDK